MNYDIFDIFDIFDIIRKVVYHFFDEHLFDESFEKQFKDYYNLTDEEFDTIFIKED